MADMVARRPHYTTVPLDSGKRVRVRIWPGRGRPVILLHGFMDCAQGWDDYCKASHRPCYAIDLPGFGGSSAPESGAATVDAYAATVCRVIDHLDLDDFVLVGHSLGGAVATRVAGMCPDRVSSLVLVAPAGYGRIPLAELCDRPLVRDALSAGLPIALMNPLAVSAAYQLSVSGGKQIPAGMMRRLAGRAFRLGPGAEAGLRAIAHMSRSCDGRFAVSSYTGPVRVLWGTRDRLVPVAHAGRVRRIFPQARVHIWEGMAHHPQVERPDDLRRIIEHGAGRARRHRTARRRALRRARALPVAA